MDPYVYPGTSVLRNLRDIRDQQKLWAGEFRTVNISRAGQFPFAFPEQIIPNLDKTAKELAQERLENIEAARFPARAAHYMGEINAIHPFRDGNGRTQREFIRQLAGKSGRSLDWSSVTREEMIEA